MFEKEAEEWADKMYPCDGQAQRYLLIGAEFGYNKGKSEAKEIIRRLLSFEQIPRNCLNERYRKLLEEAEQFLKESEK